MTDYRAALVLGVGLALGGCIDGGEDELEDDPYAAQIEPDCGRTGELIVELGEGFEGFEALGPGQAPALHHGVQGGTHLILAARLSTPDPLDRYEIDLLAEISPEPCLEPQCPTLTIAGQIHDVIEGPRRIYPSGDDAVEIPALVLVVDGWAASPTRRVTLELVDACGREARVVREFPL